MQSSQHSTHPRILELMRKREEAAQRKPLSAHEHFVRVLEDPKQRAVCDGEIIFDSYEQELRESAKIRQVEAEGGYDHKEAS